ncbi:hypothetical protein I4U23_012450 [Adineta vaga]|nr:hypothetical protein I4U23_012450 [Adineta vaga]
MVDLNTDIPNYHINDRRTILSGEIIRPQFNNLLNESISSEHQHHFHRYFNDDISQKLFTLEKFARLFQITPILSKFFPIISNPNSTFIIRIARLLWISPMSIEAFILFKLFDYQNREKISIDNIRLFYEAIPDQDTSEQEEIGFIQQCWMYAKNNINRLNFLILYILYLIVLILYRALILKNHSIWQIFARIGGILINFNYALAISLMLKQTMTIIRRLYYLRLFIPVDDYIDAHRFVGTVLFVSAMNHSFAHAIYFATDSKGYSWLASMFTKVAEIGWTISLVRNEWHPFTICSAPQQKNILRLTIMKKQNWTRKIYEYLENMISIRSEFIYPKEMKIDKNEKDAIICIEGPFSTCTSYIFDCEHVVLIGTGIDITPYISALESLLLSIRNIENMSWFRNILEEFENEQESYLATMMNSHEQQTRNPDIHLYCTSIRNNEKAMLANLPCNLVGNMYEVIQHEDMDTQLKTRTHVGRPLRKLLFANFKVDYRTTNVFFTGNRIIASEIQKHCNTYGFSFQNEPYF